MARFRRRASSISVVVPVFDVAAYLPACLDSLLAQTHRRLEIIVVDDGSPDDSGAIAEDYAGQDSRVRVVHIENRGLGGARNEGVRHATGDWLAFADSDDIVPPKAYEALLRQALRSRAELVTGDVVRLVGDALEPMAWSTRLRRRPRSLRIEKRPELLLDVFAWNKLYRRDFWEQVGLTWPERIRYEDQPTTTEAYVAAHRLAVTSEVVYQWRERHDASSITQQRSTVADLKDRWTTKRMALRTVEAHGSAEVIDAMRRTVLPWDLWPYFECIPGASQEWWELLVTGIRELWPGDMSLADTNVIPLIRLTGWLVEQERRADAETVAKYVASNPGPLPRVPAEGGGERVEVPGLDMTGIPVAAVRVAT